MNSKNNLLIIAFIGIIIVGGALYVIRKPSDNTYSKTDEENEVYDSLNSEIIDFLAEFDAQNLRSNSTDEVLTIELFEPEPENEELGEIS
jgi:hypothetical protein